MEKIVESFELYGKSYRFETGELAKQATGAVLVTQGETTVLVTAVISKEGRRMTGEKIIESMIPMHDRSNGLGGGFAAYGIDQLRMSETEAHRYIEKQAMDRCVSRRVIAEKILSAYR